MAVFVGWLVVCAALILYRAAQRIRARPKARARLANFLTVLAGDGRRRLDAARDASEG